MTASSYQPIIFPKYWQTDNVKPLMTNIGLPFAVRWPKHDLKREHFHLVVVHWRQRKVYEEVCCTCKVVVLLILDCFQTFSLLSWYLKFPSYAVKQRWQILPPLLFLEWGITLVFCNSCLFTWREGALSFVFDSFFPSSNRHGNSQHLQINRQAMTHLVTTWFSYKRKMLML